jgi:2-octaprenyl-6-methoxyphenol hydroxylase
MAGDAPFDLAIIGGGMTGLALACATAGAAQRVLLVERQALAATIAAPFDGRVTAIAPGSRCLLGAIGVWPELAGAAEPIRDIRVGERHSPLTVHYDHRAVGDQPLGHIVENRVIRGALLRRIERLRANTLTLAAPDQVVGLERGAAGAELRLASGRTVRAALVVVATLAHERPHQGLAVERFFPDGPLALLPMTGRRSSIVWAAEDRLARELTRLDDADFVAELGERAGDRLGAFTLAGPRWHYPLAMIQAQRYTDRRLALVGDAAHAIHPIAGQGWNLALRDVAALAELVIDAARLGLDPGGASVLAHYERWRRFDSLALIAITDGLNRLFGNDLLPVRLARELGLGLVERTPPLKRFFMRHAMGLLGDLPRLMRGEAL